MPAEHKRTEDEAADGQAGAQSERESLAVSDRPLRTSRRITDHGTLELLCDQLRTDALRHRGRMDRAKLSDDQIFAGILAECSEANLTEFEGVKVPKANGHRTTCTCRFCQRVAQQWITARRREQAEAKKIASGQHEVLTKRGSASVRKLNKAQRREEILKRFADPASPTFADATASAKVVTPEVTDSQAYNLGKDAIQNVRQRILGAHSRAGITDDYLADRLRSLLDAKKTEFFAHKGEVIEEREVEAHNIRLGAAELAHKLRGEMPREEPDIQASLIIRIGGDHASEPDWELRAEAERKRLLSESAKVITAQVVEESGRSEAETPTAKR